MARSGNVKTGNIGTQWYTPRHLEGPQPVAVGRTMLCTDDTSDSPIVVSVRCLLITLFPFSSQHEKLRSFKFHFPRARETADSPPTIGSAVFGSPLPFKTSLVRSIPVSVFRHVIDHSPHLVVRSRNYQGAKEGSKCINSPTVKYQLDLSCTETRTRMAR